MADKPMGVPSEDRLYLAKQLGMIVDGDWILVHPSTRRSLHRRGFIDHWSRCHLTDLGREALAWATDPTHGD